MPRQTRQQRFTSAFPQWNTLVNEGSNRVLCLCLECEEQTTFTAQALNRLAKLGAQPVCKSLLCSPPIPKGPWNHLDTDHENRRLLLECEECQREHWHHKLDASYLVCFCTLKTKKKEAAIYDELCNSDQTVLREVYFDKILTSHKCDMMVLYGGREIFIEVDGLEHGSAVKREADEAFHDLFYENRKETQFLVRIPDYLDPEVIASFAQELENLILTPISRLLGIAGSDPIFEEL